MVTSTNIRTWSSFASLLCLGFALTSYGVAGRKVEFLKEILTGRCYYNPPTGIAGSCPTVVDYIIGGLEGNVDKDITVSTFSSYFAGANFRPGAPGNEGLFWLNGNQEAGMNTPKGWTTPETTPGGAMMDGLNFCGIDLRQDCPRISEASTVFWTSAYKAYAKEVKREVHIVLEEGAYLSPLLEGGIPNLPADASVTLYASDCDSKGVQTVKEAFWGDLNQTSTSHTLREITCTENAAVLVLCQDPESTACHCLISLGDHKATEENQVKETAPPSTTVPSGRYSKQKGGNAYTVLFFLVVLSLGFYALSRRQGMKGYRAIPLHSTVPPVQS
jgi:hypothetical protein